MRRSRLLAIRGPGTYCVSLGHIPRPSVSPSCPSQACLSPSIAARFEKGRAPSRKPEYHVQPPSPPSWAATDATDTLRPREAERRRPLIFTGIGFFRRDCASSSIKSEGAPLFPGEGPDRTKSLLRFFVSSRECCPSYDSCRAAVTSPNCVCPLLFASAVKNGLWHEATGPYGLANDDVPSANVNAVSWDL